MMITYFLQSASATRWPKSSLAVHITEQLDQKRKPTVTNFVTHYPHKMQSNSDAYVAAWFSQDIANAAAVAKTFVQSRNDAHDQRVTVTLFLVIIIVVGDQCSH